MVGYMPMPADFRYKELFMAGPPVYQKFDEFWCRHPSMDLNRRAKIFAPFDALKGFSEAVGSKEIHYVKRHEISPEASEKIERQLRALSRLTANGKLARNNSVIVTIEYFVPCSDPNNAAYSVMGQYEQYTGIVWEIDYLSRSLIIGTCRISFDDILSIKKVE